MIKNYNQGEDDDFCKISENFPNSLEGWDFWNFEYDLSTELRMKILEQIKSTILKTYKLFKSTEKEIRKRFYEIAKGRNEDKNEQFKIWLRFIGGNLIRKTQCSYDLNIFYLYN